MKKPTSPWRRQCLLGLSSLYLSSQLATAQASYSVEHITWEQTPPPAFSQAAEPRTLIISQRIERRDGAKPRDKLRRQPDRRNSAKLFERPAATLKQAAKMAQQQHGGKVLKVERQQQSYRVKMLRDGRVSYVKVPAH